MLFYSGQCLECVFSFIGVFVVVVVVVQDYSWEDHGFSLVNRLLPDMGQFLDEKFQVHSTLTNKHQIADDKTVCLMFE